MKRRMALISAVAALTMAGMAQAAFVMDGSLDVGYGAPLAVQTQASNYSKDSLGGTNAQLAALYGTISDGNLNLFIAGVVAPNDGHVEIFIQSNGTGVSNMVGLAPLAAQNLRFDTGFKPNWNLSVTGPGAGDSARYWSVGNTANATYADAPAWTDFTGQKREYSFIANGLGVTFANNIDANTGLITPALAPTIQTGLEMKMSLADLGWTSGDIKVMAMLTMGGAHGEGTNQMLAPYVPQAVGTAGVDAYTYVYVGNYDLASAAFPGDQFVTISSVPEPTSLGFLAIGTLAFATKRRRVI